MDWFYIQFHRHNWKTGKMTIPAGFVRLHDLQQFRSCILRFEDWDHEMELKLYVDARRDGQHPDHMVIKGDFEWFKHRHNLRRNEWFKFKIKHDDMEDEGVVFLKCLPLLGKWIERCFGEEGEAFDVRNVVCCK